MCENAHFDQPGLWNWTRNEYLVTVGWNSLNVGWNFSCNEMVIRRLMLRRYMTFTNVTWSWNDSIRVTKWPFNNYIFHKTDCTYPLHENYLWRHLGHLFSKKIELTHSPPTQPPYNHQPPHNPNTTTSLRKIRLYWDSNPPSSPRQPCALTNCATTPAYIYRWKICYISYMIMKRFNLPLNGYLHMLQGSIRADKIFIQRLKISSNGFLWMLLPCKTTRPWSNVYKSTN